MNSSRIIALAVVVGIAVTFINYLSEPQTPLIANKDETYASQYSTDKLSTPASIEKQKQLAVIDSDYLLSSLRGSYLKDGATNQSTKLTHALRQHLTGAETLLTKLSKNPNDAVTSQLLESKSIEINVIRTETIKLIKQNKASNSYIEAVEKRFESVNTSLSNVVNAVTSSQKNIDIKKALNVLSKYNSPEIGKHGKAQPTMRATPPINIDINTLPEGSAPAYVSESNLSVIPEIREHKEIHSSHNILSLLGISPLYAAELPDGPHEGTSSCNVVSADTESSLPEVDVDNVELQELAQKLEYSPVKIYSYVKNHIKTQFYYGSVKGALGTLRSGSGNSTDQASLLITLLRISKIPARYVQGRSYFDNSDPRFINWVGTKTKAAAIVRLNSNGISTSETSDKVSFPHVWIEACVPYDNYRGANTDNTGHQWVPLDASYKKMSYHSGDVVPEDFSFDYDDYLSSRTHQLPQEALIEQLESHLGRSLNGIGHQGNIVIEEIDILPITTPLAVQSFLAWSGTTSSETARLPDSHRVFVEYRLRSPSGGNLVDTLTIPFSEVIGKRISLGFSGVTASDKTTISEWLSSESGDLSTVCANNVEVEANFMGNGVIFSSDSRQKVNLCAENLILNIKVFRSYYTLNSVSFSGITAYNHHVLMAYGLHASEQVIEGKNNKLLEAIADNIDIRSLEGEELDQTLGEYLDIVALKFMFYVSEASNTVGQLFGETGDSGFHIGLTSTAMRTDYLFDLPLAISGDGLLIDVPGGKSTSSNLTTMTSDFDSFLLSGYVASAYESYIWQEHAHLDAVSSVRGLQFANELGSGQNNSAIGVVNLTLANQVETQLNANCIDESYHYSSSVITKLENMLTPQSSSNSAYLGYSKITIPKCLLQYEDWKGAVWVAYKDQNGFAASYTIAGNYTAGGGYAVGSPASFNSYNPTLNTGFSGALDTFQATALNVADDIGVVFNDIVDAGLGSFSGFTEGLSTVAGDPVNLVSGNFYLPESDFTLKGRGGLNVVFNRTYNSNIRKDGPLGFGWTHSFNHQLKFLGDSGPDGRADQMIWTDGKGANNKYTIEWSDSPTDPKPTFIPQDGLTVLAKGGSYGFVLTEKSGFTFRFSESEISDGNSAKLTQLRDTNGNTIDLIYDIDTPENLSTIEYGGNQVLTLHYDNTDHHITRITDSNDRTWEYGYTNNNLTEYKTPLAYQDKVAPTLYDYYTETDGINLNHAMKSFQRPNGDSLTLQYFTNGKVFRHVNELGKSYTFKYNMFRRETTTTDEQGISQTYLFNEHGQQIEHQLGDGSRMQYQYNDTNFPLSETTRIDGLGLRSQSEYSSDEDTGYSNLRASIFPDNSKIEYKTFQHTPLASLPKLPKGFTSSVPSQPWDHFGQPGEVIDQNGNLVIYKYDFNGNKVHTIVIKKGGSFSYSNRDISSQRGSIFAWTKNTYDSYGNLTKRISITDFVNQTGPYTEYVYDSDHRNIVKIKRCGNQFNNSGVYSNHCEEFEPEYDDKDRITKSAQPNFYPMQFEYDDNDRIIRRTNSQNVWVDITYDDNGNVVNTSQLGKKSDGTYGLLVNNTNKYDDLNRNIQSTNVAGFITQNEYDNIGRLTKVTNPDGYAIKFEYDNLNRRTRAFDEQGQAISTVYDQGGRPVKIIGSQGEETQYEYYGASENGRLKLITNPDNTTLEYFYDNNGNVIKTIDNEDNESLSFYDVLNRVTRQVGPVHSSVDTSWGNLINVRQVTTTQYNVLGDVTSISAGYTTANALETADVLSLQESYTYDDFGNMLTKTDALNNTTSYEYDRYANVTKVTKPNGHIVEFEYLHDRNGLLDTQSVKLSSTDNNPKVTSYSYNELGQITQVVSPDVTYTYGYDQANRLESITDSRGNKTLTQNFSPGGLLNYVADSEGKKVAYLYDAARRITSIKAAGNEEISFAYDASGRLIEKLFSNGTSSSYSYNDEYRLATITNKTGTTPRVITNHIYTYDTLGRKLTSTDTINNTTKVTGYEYDKLGRLKAVNNIINSTATREESYQYDQFNNRRVSTQLNDTAKYYHYDAAQQLEHINNTSQNGTLFASYTYDNIGNLLTQSKEGTTTAYDYDGLERMVGLSQTNANAQISSQQYKYDHSGNRLSRTIVSANGNTTVNQYTYAGQNIWAEFDNSWTQALAHYTYSGLDQVMVRSTPNVNNSRFYHTDALGSVVATSDFNGTGALDSSSRYNAWGNITTSTGFINQYDYTGREADGSGLNYYRARYYDPTIGRFTQRDPLGFTDGINPYIYVANSPLNYTDPSGLIKSSVVSGYNQVSSYAGVVVDSGIQGYQSDMIGGTAFGTLYGATDGWVPEQSTVDFSAGVGDSVSMNLTKHLRHNINIDTVDYNSGSYKNGNKSGTALSVAIPTGMALRVGGGIYKAQKQAKLWRSNSRTSRATRQLLVLFFL